MVEIVWTEKASAHLKAIHDYIAEDSPTYAKNFVKSLVKATGKLEIFPLSGRLVPEFIHSQLNLREVIYQGYRIIYVVSSLDKVIIITVIHGRENLLQKVQEDWIL